MRTIHRSVRVANSCISRPFGVTGLRICLWKAMTVPSPTSSDWDCAIATALMESRTASVIVLSIVCLIMASLSLLLLVARAHDDVAVYVFPVPRNRRCWLRHDEDLLDIYGRTHASECVRG